MRWIAALAITALTLPFALNVRFDTRPFSALGNDPVFEELARFLSEREVLLVMLERGAEVSQETLLAAARETEAALATEPRLGEVVGKLATDDAQRLIDGAYLLWPEPRLFRLERALGADALARRAAELQAASSLPGGRALIERAFVDPLNLAPELIRGFSHSSEQIDVVSGFLMAGGGRVAAFFTRPRAPSREGAEARALFADLRALGERIAAHHPGVSLRMTGPHVFAAEYEERLHSGLALSGGVSLLLIVAWCVLLLGDLAFMLLAGATLALSALWTLGFARMIFPELQVLAVSAASILPAIGIDAAVQFHAAFTGSAGDARERVRQAFQHVRRPILIAAAASFSGFLAFLLADVAAFRQFGALLAIGVVANTLAMVTVLPGACVLLGRLRPQWLERKPKSGRVERAGFVLARASRWTRFAPLLLAVCALLLRPELERRFGFSALVDPTLEGARGQRLFTQAFAASEQRVFAVIEAPTRNRAIAGERAFMARLAEHEDLPVTRDQMALVAVTADDVARARALAERRPPEVVAREWGRALIEAGFADEVVDRLSERVRAMAEPVSKGAVELPPLARFVTEQRVRVEPEATRVYVSLFLSPGADAASVAARLLELSPRASDIHLSLTGPALVDVALQRALERDGWKLTGLALFGALMAMLAARLPAARLLVAASSLLLTFVCLYGVLGWLGMPLTLVTLLVFPFVLGVGVDATVYLVVHEDFARDAASLLGGHLRPLLASTLTTLSGFLALLVVPLEDIRRLGLSVAIGLLLALAIALSWVVGFAKASR